MADEPDQVPRLERFRQAHPEVEIMTPLDTRSPFWKAYRDGQHLGTGIDLRRLLDQLERGKGSPSR